MKQVTTTEANEIMAQGEQNIYIFDKMGKKIKLYVKSDIKMMDMVGIKMYVDDDSTEAVKTMIICGIHWQNNRQEGNPFIYELSIFGQTDKHTAVGLIKDIIIDSSVNADVIDICTNEFNEYFGTSGMDVITHMKIVSI